MRRLRVLWQPAGCVSCELVCVCVSLVRVVIICPASTHTALVSSPSLAVLHPGSVLPEKTWTLLPPGSVLEKRGPSYPPPTPSYLMLSYTHGNSACIEMRGDNFSDFDEGNTI